MSGGGEHLKDEVRSGTNQFFPSLFAHDVLPLGLKAPSGSGRISGWAGFKVKVFLAGLVADAKGRGEKKILHCSPGRAEDSPTTPDPHFTRSFVPGLCSCIKSLATKGNNSNFQNDSSR